MTDLSSQPPTRASPCGHPGLLSSVRRGLCRCARLLHARWSPTPIHREALAPAGDFASFAGSEPGSRTRLCGIAAAADQNPDGRFWRGNLCI